jgi:hypothetical protein
MVLYGKMYVNTWSQHTQHLIKFVKHMVKHRKHQYGQQSCLNTKIFTNHQKYGQTSSNTWSKIITNNMINSYRERQQNMHLPETCLAHAPGHMR